MNKKFLKKLILVALLVLAIPVSELLLPIDRFSFRCWEPLLLKRRDRYLPGVFYPNQYLVKDEVGDLAPYSDQQVVKRVIWETDAFGYRNTKTCDQPNAILMGDSMAAGIALSQEKTINELIKAKTGICSYSFSHDTTEHAIKAAYRWNWKPKYAFLVVAERSFSYLEKFPEVEIPPKIRWSKFFFQERGLNLPVSLYERAIHSSFVQFRGVHGFLPAIERALFPHEFLSGPEEKRKMHFYQGENALAPITAERVEAVANLISTFHEGFRRSDIQFVLIVVPNKESVYPELIPSDRRADFLPRLQAELSKRGVTYIDLWTPFRAAFEKEKKIYYHLDDTHWNADGTELAAHLVKEKLLSARSR